MLMISFGSFPQLMKVVSIQMSDSKKNQAMNMTAEIHHHQLFGCYTLEDGIFSLYFYITVYSRPIDFSLLKIFCTCINVKYVLSPMGVSKESISKFLIGNRFHVKLRILSPENCKQSLQVKS